MYQFGQTFKEAKESWGIRKHICLLHIIHPKDEVQELATSLHHLDPMIEDEGDKHGNQ